MKTANEAIDIAFVAPPHGWEIPPRMDIKPPLNLLYLASFVKAHGFATTIIDVAVDDCRLDETVARLAQSKVRFVGLPFYQGTHEATLALCAALRRALPVVRLIGGGPLLTCHPERVMASKLIDVGIIGEGEAALLAVLLAFENNAADHSALRDSLAAVDGICFVADDELVQTGQRRGIASLDSLPYLDYSLLDMEPYFALQDELDIPRSIFMTTSRGCAFRCTYCATPVLWPGPVRRYSVARVVAEIVHHQHCFPDVSIAFLDDSFFASRRWLDDFFAAITPLDIRYCCIGRADHLDDEIVAELARTGCIYVSMGVETGVAERQTLLKKGLSLERVRQAVQALSAHRIYGKCFFMLGFPGETPADMAQTINFAVELARLGMNECIFFPLILYAGTEIARGYEAQMWQAAIHEGAESEEQRAGSADAAYAAARLQRYSSVPAVDVNEYLCHEGIVDLIKLAYGKIRRREAITPAEVEACARTALPAQSANHQSV